MLHDPVPPAEGDAPGDRHAAPKLARRILRAVRDDILVGRYRPGQRLKVAELAMEHGISTSAVREALSMLVAEQLVETRDQCGFTVPPVSLADLADLTALRIAIETTALRKALARGDAAWEAALIAAEYRSRRSTRLATGASNPEAAAAEAALHLALVSACGSPRLLALRAELITQMDRYAGLVLPPDPQPRARDHRRIVELAMARDVAAVTEWATQHIRATSDRIVSGWRMPD